MIKVIKKYIIPRKDNEYKPHLLREFSVIFLSLLIVFLVPFFTFIYPALITSDFLLSAIFPSALVGFANEARFLDGALALKTNPILEEAARMKAEDMVKKNYFAHVSPEGIPPWYWLGQAKYNFSAAGENLAIDFSDSKDVSTAWLQSPGHRANILNKKFTEIGIATAKGIFNGHETVFVVQFFGKPAAVRPLPSPTPTPIPTPASRPQVASALEVVEENDLFIAVKNVDEEAPTPANSEVGVPTAKRVGKNLEMRIFEALSSPRTLLFYSYLLLSFLISLSLIFVIFIEAARRHTRHIAYGAFLLVLAFSTFYASTIIFPETAVLVI